MPIALETNPQKLAYLSGQRRVFVPQVGQSETQKFWEIGSIFNAIQQPGSSHRKQHRMRTRKTSRDKSAGFMKEDAMSNGNIKSHDLQIVLEILWRDLFHVRQQTWKILEIVLLLFGLLIISGELAQNPMFTIVFGMCVSISTMFGGVATIHHRSTQLKTLSHIRNIESELGLLRPGLIDGINEPSKTTWWDVFDYRANSTPTFFMRIHVLIFISSAIYTSIAIIGHWGNQL